MSQDLTEQVFRFRAKILRKRVLVKDVNIQGHDSHYEAFPCFLVPEPCDQTSLFLEAWLPDLALDEGKEADHNTKREVGMRLGSPLDGPCRGAVMRMNFNCDKHHILVMSVGVEQEIFKYKLDGSFVNVIVLAASDESVGEEAVDTSAPIHG